MPDIKLFVLTCVTKSQAQDMAAASRFPGLDLVVKRKKKQSKADEHSSFNLEDLTFIFLKSMHLSKIFRN